MNIAICDDNSSFLINTKNLIEKWANKPSGTTIECFEDGDCLLANHNKSPYDIIFLDVVMPILDGIETAKELRTTDNSVIIIFLTSSPEFAVASYTVKAYNYLLKPIDEKALYQSLDDLLQQYLIRAKYIKVKTKNAVHNIELYKIEFIETQNKHVLFHLTDGKTVESCMPLYTYENNLLLEDGFFKCHRSYIINFHYIRSYTTKEIKLRSGYRIPISRSIQKEFEESYFSVVFDEEGGPKC